ncbi:MAG: hypothetical protein Q4C89_01095 [Deinococcus sp.]|uniref:hypothetical protein n=1 Tax=Deinococcus sp. TaxID=47478 RepID=UPI0026DAD564|nr:hypothetical protein [Deinococcus sp.]MDO4244605.1 hypothetical protein [Deinococcus sp.]
MSRVVPTVSPDLPGLHLGNLSGFRGQEDWGRWTLGKVTTVEVKATRAVQAEVRLSLNLPYTQQRLSVFFNGQTLTTLKAARQSQDFDVILPANLHTGRNELKILTDKSNLDPRLKPFAPQDLSDMAVSLKRLEFAPLQVFTGTQTGRIYGAVQPPYPSTYQQATGQQVDAFVQADGPQVLTYRLLSSADWQTFTLRLDEQVLRIVTADRRGTLISGQLPLKPSAEIQRFSVVSSPLQERTPTDDSLAIIEKHTGTATFYIQDLRVTPVKRWQQWEQPLAGLGVVLGLGLLLGLLFAKNHVNSR